ncbi:MAG TPA: VOC family protein [Actinomycetota bacterium]|nr:VOC family protein [Actinomycetota bacterium]
MPNPVVHFEIMGKESAKTQQFYRDLFEWPVDANNPMNYGMVPGGEGGIGGGIGGTEGGAEGHPGVMIYVGVPDVDAALQKANSLGATTVMGKTEVPGANVTIGMFTDPDGNQIGLVQT